MAGRGFTLIELMIIMIVIAIIALIVIPAVARSTRRAREATLRANLRQLREAIAFFHTDTGLYPVDLSDITTSTPPTQGVDGKGNTVVLPSKLYRGPYLTTSGGIGGSGLPLDPFVGHAVTQWDQHWKYTPVGGRVTVPDTFADEVTTDGKRYGDL